MSTTQPEILLFDSRLKEERDYWLGRLSGQTHQSNFLPVTRRFQKGLIKDGAVEIDLPVALQQSLKTLTGNSPFLVYTALLAALNICLYNYTGDRHIIVGSPALKDVEHPNTLAIINQINPQVSFRKTLLQTRETLLQAYANQHYPFERLLQDLGVNSEDTEKTLFDIALVLKEIHGTLPEVGNKITLALSTQSNEISGRLEFSTTLFSIESIHRFRDHLITVLEEGLKNLDRHICEQPLLTEIEQHLLTKWNATQVDYPAEDCFSHLFEIQAAQTQDAIAAICEDKYLTYEVLNRSANQVAHYLKQWGVSVEARIGLFMERSIELLVGLLGIVKAGGAYVPLDPMYPKQRLNFILQDAQVHLLLTHSHLAAQLPDGDVPTIYLDTLWPVIAQNCTENLTTTISPDNLLYMLYTSGSTGLPKGVMIPHRGVVNYLSWCKSFYQVSKGRGAPVHSSIGFDLTVTSLLLPLLTGRSVWLLPGYSGPEELNTLLQHEKDFSLIKVTPAHLQMIERSFTTSEISRWAGALIIGGEAVLAPMLRLWQTCAPDTRLINEYGPTETVVGCSVYVVPQSAELAGPVPIGLPIGNTQIYLLDPHLRLVPLEVIGELYIGGIGVGRGYWHRPDMTAERFIPDPFSNEPGARLYKTGDLARRLPDGNIEFLGRTDYQVKIRGFRIELGEVESILSQHVAVRENVVVISEEAAGDPRLVAYIVPDPKQKVSVSELYDFMRDRLPAYMLPSTFILLEALPLTSNGKIDRQRLPASHLIQSASDNVFANVSTPLQEILVDMWKEVLGIGRLSIYDDFFEQGGHSLLAMSVLSRLRHSLRVDVPLRQLFEHPTIAEFAEVIEQALGREQKTTLPAIVPVSRNEDLSLSFAQQRLWFLNQLEPDSPFDNVYTALRLRGSLNRVALERSFCEIIRRHEILRTTFVFAKEGPLQVIAAEQPFYMPLVDLRSLSEGERRLEVERLALAHARQLFQLDQGPLFTAELIWCSDGQPSDRAEEHVLLLNVHHIISDAWSTTILIRELTTLYNAFSTGQEALLPKLPIQYADYAHWQRQWLKGSVVEQQLDYWKKKLGGSLPVLHLPTDRPRSPIYTYRGASLSFKLSKDLTDALRNLGLQNGVTLYMTLLAAFKTLLYRYSGQEDILVGSPIAGRQQVETESLIGFFVNTLILRTDLSGNPTFRDLLHRVREVTLDAYAHQEVPFEMLVEAIQPERDVSHTPLFQVMFHLENTPKAGWDFQGMVIEPIEVHNATSALDLILNLVETSDGLTGALEFSTELFEFTTIRRLITQFQTLLEAVIVDPNQRLSDSCPLPKAELQKVLVEWNNTTQSGPYERCIHELFEEQALKTPDAVAVVFEDKMLTYKELDCQTTRLAQVLQGAGAGPETVIGMYLGRSHALIVAMLGILKAGAAYLPLDPNYPSERISFILSDSQAALLITEEQYTQRLPEHSAQVIYLDRCLQTNPRREVGSLDRITCSDNLAYVIYTSGSSGLPKGVQILHRAVINFMWAMRHQPGIAGQDVVLAVTTPSFDIAVVELLLPLVVGAKIVIVSDEIVADGILLGMSLTESSATLMQATPTTWQLLLESGWKGDPSLTVWCGGEALGSTIADQLLTRAAVVWNLYGPTESTVWSTIYQVQLGQRPVSIGRPIANTSVYLLDPYMNPVPIGVQGELYIGGWGLARAYLNRPELTSLRFVPNPFSNEPNSRLYRTGDLARYLHNGDIEFLGRADHQIKLRGFRIEMEEIENVLCQHPEISECVVLLREDNPGDKRIVAYLVPRHMSGNQDDRHRLSINDIRRYMLNKVPDYLIPSTFVFLDKLPLTANRKVDRRSLPQPDLVRPALEADYVAPQTELENIVTHIWQEVLQVQQVGVNDNFFDLGGHSILVVQIQMKIQEQLGYRVPLVEMFRYPTIRLLVKHISGSGVSTVANNQGDQLIMGRQRLQQRYSLMQNNPKRSV
ncbi:nonribosomal peptide synthetase DhbF [Thermoflexales bacterium]|nr:nonribosomal peptide synthetase DhbF [Thermoflexales bacterium]